jgi:hypothetical protein
VQATNNSRLSNPSRRHDRPIGREFAFRSHPLRPAFRSAHLGRQVVLVRHCPVVKYADVVARVRGLPLREAEGKGEDDGGAWSGGRGGGSSQAHRRRAVGLRASVPRRSPRVPGTETHGQRSRDRHGPRGWTERIPVDGQVDSGGYIEGELRTVRNPVTAGHVPARCGRRRTACGAPPSTPAACPDRGGPPHLDCVDRGTRTPDREGGPGDRRAGGQGGRRTGG